MRLGEAALQLVELGRRKPGPVPLLLAGLAVVGAAGRQPLRVEAADEPRGRMLVVQPTVVHRLDVRHVSMVAAQVVVVIAPLQVLTVLVSCKKRTRG